MGEYLSQYLAGDTHQVWNAIGGLVYAEISSHIQSDVLAVCEETMRRVHQNTERIASALTSLGYQFGVYPDGQEVQMFRGPLVGPDPSIESKIHTLAASVGSIPLSLKAFWKNMDAICLIGKYPDWPTYSDPLTVDPVDVALEEMEIWQELVKENGLGEIGPFRVPISPDKYHKDNVSGGDWYGIELPCSTVDVPLSGEPHNTTFIDYLRIAIGAMGFPGVSEIPMPLAELKIELVNF